MKKVTLGELLKFLEGKGEMEMGSADEHVQITGGRNIVEAGPGEFTFLSVKYRNSASALLKDLRAPLVIVDKELMREARASNKEACLVATGDPKALMIQCLKQFFEIKPAPGIHATAVIHPGVKMGSDISIGAYAVIDEDVTIGDRCTIEPFVHLKAGCRLGNYILIKSGTVVGGKGFGYVQKEDRTWENFPHFGRVVIEDNVEIGSNTCIDRGALGDTILRKGVKVDNLVHIAHNVVVGENSLIIADAMLGGSTIIGENTWVAPAASLRNGITIGKNCVIGMGAVVTKSVEDGTTVAGNPAGPMKKKE